MSRREQYNEPYSKIAIEIQSVLIAEKQKNI